MNQNNDVNPADATLQNEPVNPPEVAAPAAPPAEKKPYTGKPRGFAAMDRAKVAEIASKGGKAAHVAGTAHQFSSDEARVAGKKGGTAPHVSRGTQGKNKASTDGTI